MWMPLVVATDASSMGLGVVRTVIPVSVVASVAADTHLPTDGQPMPTDGRMPVALAEQRWSTIASTRWESEEHINVLELRAIITALHWVIKLPGVTGRRLLLLTDSMVAACGITKGRSSAPLLLRRLRYIASMVLGMGLQLAVRWIRSEFNPADEPSRRFR
jgi:ribonuclease HI